jgi:hypothetical protein
VQRHGDYDQAKNSSHDKERFEINVELGLALKEPQSTSKVDRFPAAGCNEENDPLLCWQLATGGWQLQFL